MAVSDTIVGNITAVYLVLIGVMKAYGLIMGQSYTGIYVLVASTTMVGLVLGVTLTWDVSRKPTSAIPVAVVQSSGKVCRGGICWHGVAVSSPASQVWFRLPQHHHHPFPPPL